MGANGGPDTSDWRARMAGDDTKVLERLSRYKSEQDAGKALVEAQNKLSERAKPLGINEQSTPEQIAEYRKAVDVPDVPKDAKDEAYAEAYGLKLPEGVDVPPAMLGAFAKQMNSKHIPKAHVQAAVGEFAKIQTAVQEHVTKTNVTKSREWKMALQEELGPREYEGQLEAADSWLQSEFRDDRDTLEALLNAQMPGGGLLKSHPWFIKLIAKQAMGAGYTDRIIANSLEAGGKSLAQQQQEIEALMFTDRAAYDRAAAPGGKLDSIIKARMSRGELDENGNENRRRRAN